MVPDIARVVAKNILFTTGAMLFADIEQAFSGSFSSQVSNVERFARSEAQAAAIAAAPRSGVKPQRRIEPENGPSSPPAPPRWVGVPQAAQFMGLCSTAALLKRLERSKTLDGQSAELAGGTIVARKFGFTWRLRFLAPWR